MLLIYFRLSRHSKCDSVHLRVTRFSQLEQIIYQTAYSVWNNGSIRLIAKLSAKKAHSDRKKKARSGKREEYTYEWLNRVN